MSQITNEALILACSAIGAGLAMIAVSDLVSDKVWQPDTVRQQSEEIREQNLILHLQCYLDRQLRRRQVFTVWLSH
jgi:hypothetical protein